MLMSVSGLAGWAADLQGVLADWNCTERMVKGGREKTLKDDPGCSLMKNSDRSGYGLITRDKKYYKLDDAGNNIARLLLKNTPHKDNLTVVVSGDIDGDTIKVTNMTML